MEDKWTEWYQCTNVDFCESLREEGSPIRALQYMVNATDPSSLNNWIQHFDLECAPKSQWGLFGALFFGGVTTGSLILPRLSDKFGRRIMALTGNLLHLVPASIFMLSHNLNFSLLCIYIMGIGMGGRVFVGYIFMSENMRVKDVPKATAIMFTLDALCLGIAAIFFNKISKDWQYLFGIPLLFLSCAIIAMICEEDTPKFVYSQGNYDKTRKILTRIGRKNGILRSDQ
jgi:MFS family permease